MKQRPITNEQELQKAATDLLALGPYLPLVLTVTEGKRTRTSEQNARYWSEIEFFMEEINGAISRIEDDTGYTNLETRRVVAEKLPVEHAIILFARTKEVVHEILKQICGIPTSTRLGTKEFMKFNDILDATMTTILGEINAVR